MWNINTRRGVSLFATISIFSLKCAKVNVGCMRFFPHHIIYVSLQRYRISLAERDHFPVGGEKWRKVIRGEEARNPRYMS